MADVPSSPEPEVDHIDPERDERMAKWVVEVYAPAVEIIAKTLVERDLPLGPMGAERAAIEILARLLDADPPITVKLASED